MSYLKAVCLGGSLCAVTAFAVGTPLSSAQSTDATSSDSPAAWVYVSSLPANSSVSEILGFQVAANGTLTPLPGSPFRGNVASMAVNGKYLFGADRNNLDIDTYRMTSNGSLELADQTNIVKNNEDECGYSGDLFLDHTGQSLYGMQFDGNGCSNNQYISLGVTKNTGALTWLGSETTGNWLSQPASFIGNDKYAYAAGCDGDMYWQITGFVRNANGDLTRNPNFSYTLPGARSGDFWCPVIAQADPSNHVAIVMQPVNNQQFTADGGAQIASFTADANGALTTTNTDADMPATEVGTVISASMAPSGKLLAVGGADGLQIFNFNGANPATKNTGLVKTDEIDQMFWDNDNHLYTISQKAGKLRVYTVTPTSLTEAAGSPRVIAGPQNVIVQPLPE